MDTSKVLISSPGSSAEAPTPPSPFVFGAVLLIVGAIGFSPWVVAKYARETPQPSRLEKKYQEWNKNQLMQPGDKMMQPGSMINRATHGALQLKREGDYVGAIERFTVMIQKTTRNRALNLLERGECYLYTGHNDLALQDFTQSIAINPNDADAFMVRSSAYIRLGLKDKAEADLKESRRLRLSVRTSFRNSFKTDPRDVKPNKTNP